VAEPHVEHPATHCVLEHPDAEGHTETIRKLYILSVFSFSVCGFTSLLDLGSRSRCFALKKDLLGLFGH